MDIINVNAVDDGEPQAIVILFGWFRASPDSLQKYAKLYQDRNCSTIYGQSQLLNIVLPGNQELETCSLEVAKEALKLLKASGNSNIPLITHSFGGAGCVVLEQFEVVLQQANNSKNPDNLQTDLQLVADALQRGGQVFDSSPASLESHICSKAIQSAVPNKILSWLLQILISMYFLVENVIVPFVTGKQGRFAKHWEHFLSSQVATRQVFLYSTIDHTTDATKLEEMIATRKTVPDADVFVQRFHDSEHCAHLAKHPKEYLLALNEIFDSIAKQQKEEAILGQDPDMTDYQMGMD